ncbi:MAG: 7-cyano-7-deazaguanine synthase QueC [Pyrinomonadaceae bacterium]|nr:7-cyano-7-deazaguanine synthase QueC [Pyrinomonadaceae bacterium]MCX7640273.1 7-cyano-7-deazaguanine synthase QueC [Pyrinomonadaceae bacterium]MDW8305279.1 7-cyano-7-deazaguanine synthase QueC [Acidobacteriota bacterium]
MFEKKAVCLVSGGMDSCVTAAVAHREGFELAFLHADYGQRTLEREKKAFEDIANFYGVKQKLCVNLEYLARIGGSALTDFDIEVPRGQLKRQGIPITYVPFRNANLLAVATSWAEVIGAKSIFIGAVAEDSSGYPDCRQEFYEAFQRVINIGTRPETQIEIRTPIIHLTKADIVRLGVQLGAPLNLTWSCYKREDLACGECDSCLLRLRGFSQAGLTDPIPYAVKEFI